MGVVLPDLQLEPGEADLDDLPRRSCHCPLAIELQVVASISIHVRAGEGPASGGQVDQAAAALERAVGEPGNRMEPPGSYRAICPGRQGEGVEGELLELQGQLVAGGLDDGRGGGLVAAVLSWGGSIMLAIHHNSPNRLVLLMRGPS